MGKRPRHTSDREQAAIATAPPVEDVDLPLSFLSPESSTLVSSYYDPDSRGLFVTFRHDDSTYKYEGVDLILWKGFLESKSKGKYFADQIRPFFTGKKV